MVFGHTFLNAAKILREVFLVGTFVSGWVRRKRRKIVTVGIVIVIVIVDCGWGVKNSLEWICAGGEDKIV